MSEVTLTPRTDAVLTEIWNKPHDPDHYVPPKMIEHARQLERELSALSQEAVRDEALEEAAEAVNHLALYGPPEYSLAFCEAVEVIRALKREPNAAGEETGKGQAVLAIQPSTPDSSGPAPAAPDVASMVKRLRDYRCADPWAGALMIEAAALLTQLGQGWIPVKEKLPPERPVLCLELAEEIERMRREAGGRNQFALWLLTNVDEIIAALRCL